LLRYKNLIKAGRYETAKDFWVSVKADAISIALNNDDVLLFKLLNLPESLPTVDPFLIYSNSKNKEFMESYQLINNAYEVDRSIFSKMVRPMNVSKTNIKTLKVAAGENMNNKLYNDPSANGGAGGPSKGGDGGVGGNLTPQRRESNTHHHTPMSNQRVTISETVIGNRSSNHLEIKSSNLGSVNQKRLTIYNTGPHNAGNGFTPLKTPISNVFAFTEATASNLSAKSSIIDFPKAQTLVSFLPPNFVSEVMLGIF
jgi:hypothetical protein